MSRYQVLTRGGYLNTFNSYKEASEFVESQKRIHPNWSIQIVEVA